MKATFQAKPGGKTDLHIAVQWAEIAADYDDLLAEYGKLPLAGFRPGKAPREVIERQRRREIREDFTARCGRRLAREALRERDLRSAGPIEVTGIQLDPRRDFSFTAELVLRPKLPLPDYAGASWTGATDEERRDEISEWLLAHTAGDAPEPLIRRECAPGFEPGSAEWEAAARRVKLMVILELIAEAEGIAVDETDVAARVEKIAAETGVDPGQLRRRLEREDAVTRLETLLRCEQTLDHLLSGGDQAKRPFTGG